MVQASPGTPYDLVSDVTRTGEWSPVWQLCPLGSHRARQALDGIPKTLSRIKQIAESTAAS